MTSLLGNKVHLYDVIQINSVLTCKEVDLAGRTGGGGLLVLQISHVASDLSFRNVHAEQACRERKNTRRGCVGV